MVRCSPLWFVLAMLPMGLLSRDVDAQESAAVWTAGMSRVDVTPTEPVRQAGYGSRKRSSDGVDTPLYVRGLAIAHRDQVPYVMIGVDTIGLPGSFTRDIADEALKRWKLGRSQIVFSCTHTHCGPDLVSELSNIFATEMSAEEIAAGKRYRKQLRAGILRAIEQAIGDLKPAKISWGFGRAKFAANRRVIKEGRWTSFGVQADGPVDHEVAVLKVTDLSGTLRGAVFNYACHCTTMGGDHYQINAEWAGYAAADLEASFPDAIAIPTIGCGADANPNPRGSMDLAKLHGRALGGEVRKVIEGETTSLTEPITANFSYAGLAFDLPTVEELGLRAKNSEAQVRRNAEHYEQVYREQGRLPATYPVPVQCWRFGNQLAMVFLGGEVVVDYTLRMKREFRDCPLWVSAYCNDVLGYICSQRMRNEGGYEFDRSAVYYNLPGPWADGTEDRLIEHIHKALKNEVSPPSPLEGKTSLNSFRVPPGWQLQLVASEPLVQDPINIAFDPSGRLWVVEMSDYPLGVDGQAGSGKIKILTDRDHDGVFDHAQEFLTDLAYPTGVTPWRDGAIISAAPEVFFARDTDGDGRADERNVLFDGFPLANPQHRVNGFTYGLDHSWYLASGDNMGSLRSLATGETIEASGRDLKIWPDSGKFQAVSGRTQWVRDRDDFGNWFGNDNSHPMYHYPIDQSDLARSAAARRGAVLQQLFVPAVAPPVYPASYEVGRFNDLFAANRFTSACSASVWRADAEDFHADEHVLVCEPVHNLVHHSRLIPEGSTFAAQRSEAEQSSEFLSSTDTWFRPVRVTTGTDGMLWVVDMYRAVIEHPQWIPQSWQRQINLRDGEDYGRIYRLVPQDASLATSLPTLTDQPDSLLNALQSPVGPLRDLAQQAIIEHQRTDVVAPVRRLSQTHRSPQVRLQALWSLHGLGQLQREEILSALQDPSDAVVGGALEILRRYPQWSDEATLAKLMPLKDASAPVRLRLALLLGDIEKPAAGKLLGELLKPTQGDPWLVRACLSSSTPHLAQVLPAVLEKLSDRQSRADADGVTDTDADADVKHLAVWKEAAVALMQAMQNDPAQGSAALNRLLESYTSPRFWNQATVSALASVIKPDQASEAIRKQIAAAYKQALSELENPSARIAAKVTAIELLGSGMGDNAADIDRLVNLIDNRQPLEVQAAALERLRRFAKAEQATTILERWNQQTYDARQMIAGRLMSQSAWHEALLQALETQKIDVSTLSAINRQTLAHLGSRSQRVRAERLSSHRRDEATEKLIAAYLTFDGQVTNVAQGKEHFRRLCAACHESTPEHPSPAPNLWGLSNRSRTALTTAILAPNANVEPKYQSYVVVLVDGKAISGMIASEQTGSLTLVGTDGKEVAIERSEIEELRCTETSFMPEGLGRELTPQQLLDLIAYLQTNPQA